MWKFARLFERVVPDLVRYPAIDEPALQKAGRDP